MAHRIQETSNGNYVLNFRWAWREKSQWKVCGCVYISEKRSASLVTNNFDCNFTNLSLNILFGCFKFFVRQIENLLINFMVSSCFAFNFVSFCQFSSSSSIFTFSSQLFLHSSETLTASELQTKWKITNLNQWWYRHELMKRKFCID